VRSSGPSGHVECDLRELRHRGAAKAAAIFTFTAMAYNLVRLRRLLAEPSPS
jgi:hypothetical protein